MITELRFHRMTTVLLAVALMITLTVALTGGERASAVDGPVEVVYVATGRNFPDALAGANLAATVGAPLLTVEPDLPLPATTIAALDSLDPNRIVIFGGPAAVSEAVRGALADHARSGSVTRISGTDRHDTAAQIAEALPDKVHDADLLDGLDSTDFLRSDAVVDDATTLDGQPASAFRVYTLNADATTVNTGSTSPELDETVIFRRSGQPIGHYCVDLPDGPFNARGAVGTVSTTVSTGVSSPNQIVILATLNDGCIGDGADFSVRLGNNGTLADGRYVLMIPGR